jgi:hypothetical protein
MVILDLSRPALDILIDDIHDEIIVGISWFYFDSRFGCFNFINVSLNDMLLDYGLRGKKDDYCIRHLSYCLR